MQAAQLRADTKEVAGKQTHRERRADLNSSSIRDDSVVSSRWMTGARQRKISRDGCFNARDLGGVLMTNSQTTRFGQICRADVLTRLTDRGRDQLRADGISLILDLREPAQVTRDPHPFQNDPQISYRNCPLVSADFPHPVEPELCESALDVAQKSIADIVRAIANTPRAAVFHCHLGSGRTGVVAIVMLALAGAENNAIAADFALSAIPGATGPRSSSSRQWGAESHNVANHGLAVLEHLYACHGGPQAYLQRAGVSETEIAVFVDRLRPH